MEVHKFGGTSVGDGDRIRRCAKLVAGARSGASSVVVSSAVDGVTDTRVHAALRPLLDAGQVPVVTGFCRRAPDGSTTPLGRGGSDYSATFIAGERAGTKGGAVP